MYKKPAYQSVLQFFEMKYFYLALILVMHFKSDCRNFKQK